MKINRTEQMNIQPQKNRPQFTGAFMNAAAGALRFLDTEQAIGACATDLGFMVIPRTMTDFTRGMSAGLETARREGSGTLNHAAIGPIYGGLAGLLLAGAINSKYGIHAANVFADSTTVDILSEIHYNNIAKSGNVEQYAKEVAASITNGDGTKRLSAEAQENFAKVLKDIIEPAATDKKAAKEALKANKALLRNIVLQDLGEEAKIKIAAKNITKSVEAPLKDIVENISSLSKTLFKEKVVKSFKDAKSFAEVNFVTAFKGFAMRRSLLGLAIGSAIGCCIQPLNIYLTKKKTGSDGFVGVEGREKDNTKGFKALKATAAAAFTTFALATIGKPKNFLKNIQYKSLVPTINQFKLVYGLTIASRLLAARDKDELRESLVKDTIGFSTWLLLGNFVAKGTLKGLEKLYAKARKGDVLGVVGKTRDEVLAGALKEHKINLIENGKALSFKEMLKKLPKSDKKANLALLAFDIAQIAGYAFTGLVLGVGIPKLNIFMTNRSEQKRAQQRAMNPQNNMFKPENLAFLSKEMNFTSSKMLGD